MQAIGEYIIKLSISLGIVCVFYQLVLKPLTFYTWNRFYLLFYSAICFLIPFINITPVLERSDMHDNIVVQFIPALQSLNGNIVSVPSAISKSTAQGWSLLHWLLLVMLAGAFVMFVRLIVQFISYRKLLRQAQLISDDEVKIYQVDKDVMPFSFGNSIFINNQMHNEREVKEIILHEFVHVRQKHTIDILWAELLCILNWYNPFAWWLRSLIKQNLEFIADNKVIEGGVDRKQYQYLLLKVMGNKYYAIANSFNFSSLKKRITMMNKLKNTKAHLLKFLFILPVMAVIVLSFRGNNKGNDDTLYYSMVFFDAETHQTISEVEVINPWTRAKYSSDKNGYLSVPYKPGKDHKLHVSLNFKKEGYINWERRFEYDLGKEKGVAVFEFNALRKGVSGANCFDCISTMLTSTNNTGSRLERETFSTFQNYIANGNFSGRKQQIKGSLNEALPIVFDTVSEIRGDTIIKALIVPGRKRVAKNENDKMEINSISLSVHTMYVTADSFNWESDSLKFEGNMVEAKFIEKGKDTLIGRATAFLFAAGKTTYILLDKKPIEYNSNYSFNPGEKFKVITLPSAQAIKKYGNKANDGAVEISTIEG